jgi:uncharacterized protein
MASAIRVVIVGTGKASRSTTHLRCHVKPGVSNQRQGVAAVTDSIIELCVAAQARDGEANMAVIQILSQVCGPASASSKAAP